MNLISHPALEQALLAFHVALERHAPDDTHSRFGDWVDGSGTRIVEALLKDGWQPPVPSWMEDSDGMG
ncbi:hypothetical protein GCM10023321_30280 [Pseudonocardia eucalypti]|uniref:Acyl-CoA dehydrogenase n=1 Tax=Pseudonocardia eucalypti TaxID=648755 RepID=A0ABP9Q1Y8_9PSEU|nr:hypothetical protein [Pseudonocardia eucalypti]